MRRVTQQRDAAVVPLRDRLTVGRGPAFPVLGQVDQLARPGADAFEVALHFFAAAFAHAPLFDFTAVEGHDHVVLLTATQRVVHQMAIRADPDRGGVPLQIGRKVLSVDHRAVNHMPRHARRVTDILAAHRRLHAIGADQRDASVLPASGVDHRDALVVLLDALNLGRSREFDPARGLGALEQGAVYVGPVDHGIGVAETLAKGSTRGDAADQGFVQRVVHHHLVGVDRAAAGDGADAQSVECGEGVGSELDAGADLTESRCLLEHLDGKAAPHQRECRRNATDAATGNQHPRVGTGVAHGHVLQAFSVSQRPTDGRAGWRRRAG